MREAVIAEQDMISPEREEARLRQKFRQTHEAALRMFQVAHNLPQDSMFSFIISGESFDGFLETSFKKSPDVFRRRLCLWMKEVVNFIEDAHREPAQRHVLQAKPSLSERIKYDIL